MKSFHPPVDFWSDAPAISGQTSWRKPTSTNPMKETQLDKNRFFTMAETYDRMAPYLLPCYDYLQNESIHLTSLTARVNPIVVDLGAGSGHFLGKVLERNQTARCYWIDYSDDFLVVAKRNLEKHGDRVTYVLSSFEGNWMGQVKERPDFIFSMSAIHHLTNEEKRDLYARCFEKLADKGWFLNIDEMKSVDEEAYRKSLAYWVSHVRNAAADIPQEDRSMYDQWRFHFDKWEERNIKNIDRPKQKGDDLHESYLTQIEWLKEIGFKRTDLFLKHHLWCAIGGVKLDQ
jgi:ubiquinone/menaquinone biosynthesis C-methylase UbiE